MDSIAIDLPREIFKELRNIADREQFPECLLILERYEQRSELLRLNQAEAQHLVDMLAFEAHRVNLKYPYNTDEHPKYNDDDADKWGDFFHSLLPHTLSHIKKHFDVEE